MLAFLVIFLPGLILFIVGVVKRNSKKETSVIKLYCKPTSEITEVNQPKANLESLKTCSNCGMGMLDCFKWCPYCGNDLTNKLCKNCGAEVDLNFNFCSKCGASIQKNKSEE